jgi:hypothetical protein
MLCNISADCRLQMSYAPILSICTCVYEVYYVEKNVEHADIISVQSTKSLIDWMLSAALTNNDTEFFLRLIKLELENAGHLPLPL